VVDNFMKEKELSFGADSEFCQHGNSPFTCQNCAVEANFGQLSWKRAKKLQDQKNNRFVRTNPESPNTVLDYERKKFRVELIEDENSPELTKVQGLLEETFGSEEVESEEVLRAAVAGKTPFGDGDIAKYRIFTIKTNLTKLFPF
jgi:hypothetical protein